MKFVELLIKSIPSFLNSFSKYCKPSLFTFKLLCTKELSFSAANAAVCARVEGSNGALLS